MQKPTPSRDERQPALSRRTVFAGASAVGVAAAAAVALPGVAKKAAPTSSAASMSKPQGYQLTEHVQRYYQTTKV